MAKEGSGPLREPDLFPYSQTPLESLTLTIHDL